MTDQLADAVLAALRRWLRQHPGSRCSVASSPGRRWTAEIRGPGVVCTYRSYSLAAALAGVVLRAWDER